MIANELRAALGDGPAVIVRPTEPSSMAVWVGAEVYLGDITEVRP